MSDIESNKAIVRAYMSALGKSDVEKLLSFMSDDFTWTIPQDPAYSQLAGTRNKAQWEAIYRAFLQSASVNVEYTIITMTAEGDRVACEAESHADTPKGDFNNHYHFLFTLRDGKIAAGKEYADSLYMYMFVRQ